MEIIEMIQAGLALAVAIGGFFIKRILSMMDDGQRRMTKIEIELARMKQSENDMRETLDRIEEKLDRLLLDR
tara:strand:+ start:1132 stop:1347 length:216 start_codon:yes stop_codon:yes gene_type:complete